MQYFLLRCQTGRNFLTGVWVCRKPQAHTKKVFYSFDQTHVSTCLYVFGFTKHEPDVKETVHALKEQNGVKLVFWS